MKKNIFLVSLLLFCAGSMLSAEIFFLRTGEIIIGTLANATAGTVSIQSLGQERQVNAGAIIRTETDLATIADMVLEIQLRDGTIIRGKIVDYDAEIGLFVDISFGSLALPGSTVSSIRNPETVSLYSGRKNAVGAGGCVIFPLTNDYSTSWGVNLLAETRFLNQRSVYWGTELSWTGLKYTRDTDVTFNVIDFSLYGLYKLNQLGDSLPALSFIIPYARVSAGAVLVLVNDNHESQAASPKANLTAGFGAQAGLEFRLSSALSLRGYGAAAFITQESGLFIVPKAGISMLYGF